MRDKDPTLRTYKTSSMTTPERLPSEVPSTNLEEYSALKTLIPFDQPVPLLRGPIRAGSQEETVGRFILAFKDPFSWASAYKACESQVTQQCESGARIGCSIAASDKCKTPWWKSITGTASTQDFAERARCEEREMEACLEAAKGKCHEFAKQKCFPAFRDARIAVKGLSPKVNKKEVSRLISWVNLGEKCQIADLWRLERRWLEFKAQLEVTHCKGSDILGSDDTEINEYLRTNFQK
ncbi:uncharacterized protein LOC142179038 isoform X1 [Nicotiana tabacum]|uniref:Uncharacterized protein LOC142179038 isoform X1 n=7 Tax=Nicotiana tabacum TaxID=4097 RepID=A0AC58U628_TOBAC|nr:uncharacterized protein LOC104105670 isoform X1 [Nicotiana tomentosiformis]XP_009612333.1 uncharacterized protein LOC104105670 isoform X1 [Nicotiana tomentosiformis]XP_009612334.1 uncharacterized protein LOC104105670 isoform X1 [Nicotiana tomentosiformis]XP_016448878.1 PREDICTED: uncharacterized protein LOC107773958 [Nicotiana tabacum]